MCWISISPVVSCSGTTNPNFLSFRAAIKYTSGAHGGPILPPGRSQAKRTNARPPGYSATSCVRAQACLNLGWWPTSGTTAGQAVVCFEDEAMLRQVNGNSMLI